MMLDAEADLTVVGETQTRLESSNRLRASVLDGGHESGPRIEILGCASYRALPPAGACGNDPWRSP